MTTYETKLAQAALFRSANGISEAGMRLKWTQYEKDYVRLWNALDKLNNKLIKAIREDGTKK